VAYALVRDIGGEQVTKGDTVTLTFGPAGKVYILATSPQGDLAYSGSWSYSKGDLNLTFHTTGFDKHASFKLNLAASQIQIPFHVFDAKKGSSLWNRTTIDAVSGAYRVAQATAAETSNGVPIGNLIAAAGSYVAGVTGAKLSQAASFSNPASGFDDPPAARQDERMKLGRFGTFANSDQRNETWTPDSWPATPYSTASRLSSRGSAGLTISSVIEIATGLLLNFSSGQQVNVIIDSVDQPGGSAVPLTPGLLAGDPRVHLHAKPPGIASGDPPNKKSLFIDPFLNTKYDGWEVLGKNYLPAVISLSGSVPIGVEQSKLKADGYTVAQLADGRASVENIYGALHANPGVLMIETHGGANGDLTTGSYLGNQQSTALSNLATLKSKLHVRYGIPPTAIGGVSVPSIGGPQYYAALHPEFWTWMEQSEGLDLSRSLVYVGACYTDRTPALRDAVKARAYFAFQQEAFSGLLEAVGNYLIRMLYRPTVTAEEAYYNMARIDQTDQMIYVEDAAFLGDLYPQAHVFNDKTVKSAILGVLDAYGYDGKSIVPYVDNGWLSKEVNHGQVWWLVFASRWGQDTKTGVHNLETCWSDYWSKGQLGGLADPYCNSANDGSLPTKSEVYYAIYLVSGLNSVSFQVVPRFTLNDGR